MAGDEQKAQRQGQRKRVMHTNEGGWCRRLNRADDTKIQDSRNCHPLFAEAVALLDHDLTQQLPGGGLYAQAVKAGRLQTEINRFF